MCVYLYGKGGGVERQSGFWFRVTVCCLCWHCYSRLGSGSGLSSDPLIYPHNRQYFLDSECCHLLSLSHSLAVLHSLSVWWELISGAVYSHFFMAYPDFHPVWAGMTLHRMSEYRRWMDGMRPNRLDFGFLDEPQCWCWCKRLNYSQLTHICDLTWMLQLRENQASTCSVIISIILMTCAVCCSHHYNLN